MNDDNPYLGQTKVQLHMKLQGINDAISTSQNAIDRYTKFIKDAESNPDGLINTNQVINQYKQTLTKSEDEFEYWQGRLVLAQVALAALD